MTTRAWTVFGWEKVYASVSEFKTAVPRMFPVRPSRDAVDAGAEGESVWQGEICGKKFGLAWEWAEAMPGVPALSDPMSVLSNVVLLDDEDGSVVHEDLSILFFNAAVYELPWQEWVRSAVQSGRRRPHLLAA